MARTPLPIQFDEEGVGHFRKQSSRSEVFMAATGRIMLDGTKETIARSLKANIAEQDDDIVSHIELNKQDRLGTKLTRPMSQKRYDYLAEQERKRSQLDSIIQNGAGDKIDTALQVLGSLAGGILDPVDRAVDLAFGGGMNRLIVNGFFGGKTKAIYKSLNTARKAKTKITKSLTAASIGKNAAEGVLGNVATEALIVNPLAISEQRDIDAYDNVARVAIGGLAFPIFTGVLGKSLSFLKKSPDILKGALDHVEQQVEVGKRVDLKDYIKVVKKSRIEQLKKTRADLLKEKPGKKGVRDEIIADLDQEIALTKSKKLKEVNAKKVKELDEEIKEAEDIKIDEADIRKRANSEETDLDYTAEGQKIFDEAEANPVDKLKENLTEDTNEVIEALNTLEAEGTLSASGLKELKATREIMQNAENFESIWKALQHCAKENL
jgi:hypothetical protein